MKEKKLTDEEVIKALECCTKSRCDDETTGDCPLKNDESCSTILAINALDLIRRLQYGYSSASKASEEWREKYEKERKENAEQKAEIETQRKIIEYQDSVEDRNAELQERVDELAVEKAELEAKANDTIEYWMHKYDNAVKDTAKDILDDFDKHGVYSKDYTDFMRKEYGVEVEE